MIFASGEPLILNNNSRTLFIVVRGVVARAGVIMGKHSVVGDDMIINNSYLRCAARPCCVTFIEVNYLRNESLQEIRQAFHVADERIRKAQVRWALWRGFVMAAWHRVNNTNMAGPRTTEYFKNEVPSFSTKEAMQAYGLEVTPRGSSQDKSLGRSKSFKRRNSFTVNPPPPQRRQSFTGMGMAASPMMGWGGTGGLAMPLTTALTRGEEAGGRSPGSVARQRSPQVGQTQTLSPMMQAAARGGQGPSGGEAAQILEALDLMRQEVNDGIHRLEARLERVERRVNPTMLG